METYNDISFLESLGNIFRGPEITFMSFDIGIAVQAPHGPSFLGLFELESSAVSRDW
jgi:hypothetical protein